MSRGLNLLIAGGGTGGHLFPGIAIARVFMAKNPENRVLFVGTDKPFEKDALLKAGFEHKAISSEGIKSRGFWQKIKALQKIPRGIAQSLSIIQQFKPDMALGVGGYSSGPVLMTAWLMNIPVLLQEQNILPGITNRILAPLAQRIYISFEDSKSRFNSLLRRKLIMIGNPVREEVLSGKQPNPPPPFPEREWGISPLRSGEGQGGGVLFFTVLILGGSQGAHAINMAAIESLEYIVEKEKFRFIHQTGSTDEMIVKDAYARFGMNSVVKAFFDDMGNQYQQADMIICRAGATTVAEITAIGKPAILIPYPLAADNHQVLNAKVLTDNDAAEMILEKDLNAQMFAAKIEYYASHREISGKMAENAKLLGKPDAAKMIVEDCYNLLGR